MFELLGTTWTKNNDGRLIIAVGDKIESNVEERNLEENRVLYMRDILNNHRILVSYATIRVRRFYMLPL